MEAVGQRFAEEDADVGSKVILDSVDKLRRPSEAALSYREREALRAQRLQPAHNEAARRLREAEAELSYAQDRLGTAATNLLLGETSEEVVTRIEEDIARAERDVARWRAAHQELDSLRGIIRDQTGAIL